MDFSMDSSLALSIDTKLPDTYTGFARGNTHKGKITRNK